MEPLQSATAAMSPTQGVRQFLNYNWKPASTHRPSRRSHARGGPVEGVECQCAVYQTIKQHHCLLTLPTPPMLGLQLSWPMLSSLCVTISVRAPTRAAAAAASQPGDAMTCMAQKQGGPMLPQPFKRDKQQMHINARLTCVTTAHDNDIPQLLLRGQRRDAVERKQAVTQIHALLQLLKPQHMRPEPDLQL
jgi:hypothetical protein